MVCHFNTLRTGDAHLRLYAYKQFKYPVPNVLKDKTANYLLLRNGQVVTHCVDVTLLIRPHKR
jgi:hypothetical protein